MNEVKVRELARLLELHGWQLKRTKGSHRQFRHPAKGMVVTVSGNLGKDLPIGTQKAIFRSAGLDQERES
jgi:predicted RNA binding protein YcfA (HicA-like mRNA interferase family)